LFDDSGERSQRKYEVKIRHRNVTAQSKGAPAEKKQLDTATDFGNQKVGQVYIKPQKVNHRGHSFQPSLAARQKSTTEIR
jgi:hypothetical protein